MRTNMEDKQQEPRQVKRHLRWGRVILLLLVLAVVLTSVFWATVWAYENIYKAPKVKPVGANEKITSDARLNSRINVLLLGIDDGDSDAAADEPKRTDAILVASFDPVHNEVALLSIPRDTQVVLPGHSSFDKVNAAYAYGGVMMAQQTIANLLRIPVHYYVLLNWQGFIDVIDIIGGIEYYVEDDMNYEDPYAGLEIHIKQGYQHLDGKKAGQYIRFRNDELGDIGRVQRQQRFLKALASELFSIGNVVKVPSLINSIEQHVETDMDFLTMVKTANSFKVFGGDKLKAQMLYGEFQTISGISYWVTDKRQTEQTLKELNIPYKKTKG